MKKICLVVGNTLPVPAVMGGAVEELITMLLDHILELSAPPAKSAFAAF